MCHIIRLSLCVLILASPAGAQDECGSARPLNACELAEYYKAIADELLPVAGDDFGIAFKVVSAATDGPEITVRAKTLKPLKSLEKQMEAKGKSMQEMQAYWRSDAIDGICGSVEGPAFLSAGGRVGIVMTSADRKPILNFVLQTCAGT